MISRGRLLRALAEAVPHVRRQATAGRHEQDRKDSKQWQAEFGDIVRLIKQSQAAN